MAWVKEALRDIARCYGDSLNFSMSNVDPNTFERVSSGRFTYSLDRETFVYEDNDNTCKLEWPLSQGIYSCRVYRYRYSGGKVNVLRLQGKTLFPPRESIHYFRGIDLEDDAVTLFKMLRNIVSTGAELTEMKRNAEEAARSQAAECARVRRTAKEANQSKPRCSDEWTRKTIVQRADGGVRPGLVTLACVLSNIGVWLIGWCLRVARQKSTKVIRY